jgi:nucleoside-diphosphate-sugar epimerase
VRSTASAQALAAEGIEPLIADLDAAPPPGLAADRLFWFAPPPATGATDPRLRAWLGGIEARRIVYLSTSGVYGDCQGRWIDESEPLKPQTDRGRRRVDAEAALAGHAVVRAQECPPTNRIHAEDLADVSLAAVERGRPGAAYNVSDGTPSTMTEYFLRTAQLLGLPEPPQVSLAEAHRSFTPAMLSFLDESKRLLTARMRHELAFTPRYPDLACGLPASL